MSDLALQIVSLAVGAAVTGGGAYVAVRVSVAKLEAYREGDLLWRKGVEAALGMGEAANGSAFMRRGECRVLHEQAQAGERRVSEQVEAVAVEVHGVREAVGEMREAVAGLGGRMSSVERQIQQGGAM